MRHLKFHRLDWCDLSCLRNVAHDDVFFLSYGRRLFQALATATAQAQSLNVERWELISKIHFLCQGQCHDGARQTALISYIRTNNKLPVDLKCIRGTKRVGVCVVSDPFRRPRTKQIWLWMQWIRKSNHMFSCRIVKLTKCISQSNARRSI